MGEPIPFTMPRRKELQFLREKLEHAQRRNDTDQIAGIKHRINQLMEQVSAFLRNETRDPYSFKR